LTSEEITVAIATCGRPDALVRCLAGLASGGGRPGEVLVVDQAPSRAASAAVDGSGLARARYIPQERRGLSASRNLALASATLPVLAVTDDDCVPDPGWVDALGSALSRAPAPAAVTGSILPLGEGGPGLYAISLRRSATPVDHAGRVLPWAAGSGANFAASREVLQAQGGWDERLGTGSPGKAAEDADLLHRLLRSGHVVRYEPEAIVRHEWQTRDRRLATRWSYGYGVGAMCGLWLRRGDLFAPRLLAEYLRLHARPFAAGVRRRDSGRVREHALAFASVFPGLVHGLLAKGDDPGRGGRE
jgi:GT2 family glycosyltransferase